MWGGVVQPQTHAGGDLSKDLCGKASRHQRHHYFPADRAFITVIFLLALVFFVPLPRKSDAEKEKVAGAQMPQVKLSRNVAHHYVRRVRFDLFAFWWEARNVCRLM